MKSRFCPSPTGYMHLGNARTALFNYLAALKHDGCFLLRIEDTDQARSMHELAVALMADLHWLGIYWQEGPNVEGSHGPYWQSKRQAIYDEYYQKLEQLNAVYPCFCTDADLSLQRKVQQAANLPPRYNGTCQHLSAEQIAAKRASGLNPTLRFRVPAKDTVRFDDYVKGVQEFQTAIIGDFIIRRADGTASFLFCNAIDDALMGVNCALRGEDHLSNTPRQLLILQALSLPSPHYGHISLILGADGAPLSKRNGSMSIADLRTMGYLPEAVRNYLSRLGHYYENNALMSAVELAAQFDFSHLGTAPARFDQEQLVHWQREAVLRLNAADFWTWCEASCAAIVPVSQRETFISAIQGNVLFPSEAAAWASIFFTRMTWQDDVVAQLQCEHLAYCQAAHALLLDYHQDYFSESEFKAFIQTLGNCLHIKAKALYHPLRLAITGEAHGPDLATIAKLVPLGEMAQRFARVIE